MDERVLLLAVHGPSPIDAVKLGRSFDAHVLREAADVDPNAGAPRDVVDHVGEVVALVAGAEGRRA